MPLLKWELFVDGKRFATIKPEEKFKLDTKELAEGSHELRVVAIIDDPIRTQGEAISQIGVNNALQGLYRVSGASKVQYGQKVNVSAGASGAETLTLMCNGRTLATAKGDKAEFTVDSRMLGMGEVTLYVLGELKDSPTRKSPVCCPPLTLTVDPPPAAAADGVDAAKLLDGPMMIIGTDKPVLLDGNSTINNGMRNDWLQRMPNVKPDTKFEIGGFVTAETDEMHQFQLYTDGACELVLDGRTLKPSSDAKGWQFFPVNLKKGPHRLLIKAVAGPNRVLNLRFGGKGTWSLTPRLFKHVKE